MWVAPSYRLRPWPEEGGWEVGGGTGAGWTGGRTVDSDRLSPKVTKPGSLKITEIRVYQS